VRFGAAFWINRTTWPDLRDTAVAVERAGWDALYVDDHLLADEGDWTDGKLEGWTTLAALATQTTRVRLGLLVAANGFRSPGLTAKLATTLDHLSDGRLILGIGGGWFEREHDAFGLDFGAGFGERLDRLDEAVGLIRRLLDGERIAEHVGPTYTLRDARCAPQPLQARLPILIGGSGPTKTLRTTARDADLWNGYGDPARIAEVSGVLRQRCAEIGRPFEAIDRTVTVHVVVRDTVEVAEAAWAATAARHGLVGRVAADGTGRGLTIGGPPDVVAAYLDGYRRIGVAEVIPVFRDPFDHETIERLSEVRAALETIPDRHGHRRLDRVRPTLEDRP
jgi:alkanesulfonate monooxygenase SsuD/methylene tetrahydromethanopterin reductase-like flavin-dependent oxidoreductase (luciferase family)